MVIDLNWAALKEVVRWAESAHKAAKTKAERRISNVVEHAGVIVGGVTRLDSQIIQLVKPLAYFEPIEWDAARRSDTVRDLILFAEERVVVPRLRSSRESLRALIPDLNDRDIAQPAAELLLFADRLFEFAPPRGHYPWSSWRNRQPSAGDKQLQREFDAFEDNQDGPFFIICAVGSHEYAPDATLAWALPNLIGLIRQACLPVQTRHLQKLAADLTGAGAPHGEGLNSDFNRSPGQSLLAPYTAEMQAAFGRVVAASQRAFPELPGPSWMF